MDTSTDGSGIVGQQGLNAATSEFNQNEFQIDQAFGKISTVKIVKVVAVKNAGEISPVGFVDIQIMVNLVDGLLGSSMQHEKIFNVPYARLQGGKNAIIIDPVVGDIGFAVIADRDISAVKSNKDFANPGSFRRFSAADAIYIGGILNGVPEQYIQFNNNGVTIADKNSNKIELKSGEVDITSTLVKVVGNLQITGTVDVKGLATLEAGMQLTGNITGALGVVYAGNIHTSGEIIGGFGGADQVGLQTHTHRYDRPTGASAPAQTISPTAGT